MSRVRRPAFSYRAVLIASYFFKKATALSYYESMRKVMKPVVVIILAVGVAAGAAVFLSRGTDKPTENALTPSHAEIKPGGHSRGPQNAPVTLVEFGDYECPVCGTWFPFVNELLTRYPDKLRLEFHHYPLVSVHPNAMAGAMAVEAAGEQ